MEANTHAFQATPHRCDAPQNGVYSNCDRGGCGESTRDIASAYGPGASFTINTRHPFEVRTAFFEDGGAFVRMRTTLVQEGQQVIMEHENCASEYLQELSEAMASGMSLRITYWGEEAETMSWLDRPPCGSESCSASAGNAVINNIVVRPLLTEMSDPLLVMRKDEDTAAPRGRSSGLLSWTIASGGLTFVAALLLAALRFGRARRATAPRGETSAVYTHLVSHGGLSPPQSPQSLRHRSRGGSQEQVPDVSPAKHRGSNRCSL